MTNAVDLFVDTSIFVYAAGGDHPLRDVCQQALRHIVATRIVFDSAVELSDEVWPVETADVRAALEIASEHDGASPRDAVHVASMRRRGVERILSTDRDFDTLPGVVRVDPERLL